MPKGKLLTSIKAQINIRIKILGSKGDLISFMKSTIEQLKEALRGLFKQPISESKAKLFNYLQSPDKLIGHRFSQKLQNSKGRIRGGWGPLRQRKTRSTVYQMRVTTVDTFLPLRSY